MSQANDKPKKTVGILNVVESDAESESDHDINIQEYEAPYEGKWKKVEKSRKTNARDDAILKETRPSFQWRVPSWP